MKIKWNICALIMLVILQVWILVERGIYNILLSYVEMILMASILFYLKNIVFECVKKTPLGEKIEKYINFFMGAKFLSVSFFGVIFIIREGGILIAAAGIKVVLQKRWWNIIVIAVMVGAYLLKNRKEAHKKGIEIIQLICYSVFLLYLPFTYSENIKSDDDFFRAEDFFENYGEQGENYDTVFRVHDAGMCGSIQQVMYTGRDEMIAQKYQFKYVVYHVGNSMIKNEIVKQWLEQVENAGHQIIEGVEVYNVSCRRFQNYELGQMYRLKDEEVYDEIILAETQDKIVIFCYRNFNHLTKEEVINIVVNKCKE